MVLVSRAALTAIHLAVLPFAFALEGARAEHDAVSMVQSSVASSLPGNPRFSVGDHVVVNLLDGPHMPGTAPAVRGSITGMGSARDSYNVHLWMGPPSARERLNVPVELLADARKLEAEEAERQKAAEEARIKREAEMLETQKREEESRRRAEAKRQEAERQAAALRREAEREARRAAEEHQRAEEEQQRAAQERRRAAEEEQRRAAEEQRQRDAQEAAQRAQELERSRTQEEARRLREEQQRVLMRASLHAGPPKAPAAISRATGVKSAEASSLKKANREDKMKVVVKDLRFRKKTVFTLSTSDPLGPMIEAAAERLGIQGDRARVLYNDKVLKRTDSLNSIKLQPGDFLEMKGPPTDRH
mmetsp:Transcript_126125/g.392644  ORF Transcript_126125/g.392644 Transcript_126125/m.392644 type:complete len:361 (+) Transcript_126125:87-1169(+)